MKRTTEKNNKTHIYIYTPWESDIIVEHGPSIGNLPNKDDCGFRSYAKIARRLFDGDIDSFSGWMTVESTLVS